MSRLFRLLVLSSLLALVSVLVPASAAAAPPPTPVEAKEPPSTAERHESGLVSLVLTPGTGEEHPDGNDIVVAHYTGWTRDAEEFVSSRKAGKPGTFRLATVFPGWREGIKQMVEGEVRRLWVPEHLGPENPQSGPRSAVFDVELVEIREMPDPPAALDAAPEGAERTPSGARFVRVEEGEGDTPHAAARVLVEWSAWHESGRLVNSTAARGRPTAFLLDRVLPAFAEVLQDMQVGERRLVWLSDAIHGGQWPGAPKKGTLVFDLELVKILPDDALQLDG